MVLTIGFLALFCTLHVVASPATATSTFVLNSLAKAAGKRYFGTATDNPELTDMAYVSLLSNTDIFGQLTPGDSMKWDATEPKQGIFDFSGGDQIVALAESNEQIVRGHNLVWYRQIPNWVAYGSWTYDTLKAVVQNHVTTEVSHYAGKIYAWDVINEPFNEDGTFRSDVFYNTMGADYLITALRAARAADPNAKLYINEYGLEYYGSKMNAMVTLVEWLQSEGVPIDGIGFQAHYILGKVDTSALKTNMESFTALGVEVAVTELDDRIPLPATDADLQQQKSDYEAVVATCMAVSGCVGVTIWDFTDKYSWVPSTFGGYGEACPWDANLYPKPAYDGIAAGFQS